MFEMMPSAHNLIDANITWWSYDGNLNKYGVKGEVKGYSQFCTFCHCMHIVIHVRGQANML